MANQITLLDPAGYAGIQTVSADATFVAVEAASGAGAPSIIYEDLEPVSGAVQAVQRSSGTMDTVSHTGTISLDADSYSSGDTVTVTLEDADLNLDPAGIESFAVVTTAGSPLRDTVGTDVYDSLNLADLPTGPLGLLVEIAIDNVRWAANCADGAVAANGLGASGFVLTETAADSGVFEGTFTVPLEFCRAAGMQPEDTSGTDILRASYVDFRDSSGGTVAASDAASIAGTGNMPDPGNMPNPGNGTAPIPDPAPGEENCDMAVSGGGIEFAGARYGLLSDPFTQTITNTGNLVIDAIEIGITQWGAGPAGAIPGIKTLVSVDGGEYRDLDTMTLAGDLVPGASVTLDFRADMRQYDGRNAPTGLLEQAMTYAGSCIVSQG